MDHKSTDTSAAEPPPYDITGGGERISPDLKNWGYYAHLSIYDFCGSFVQGARVLDAGCGTGYGCHHLLSCGAEYVVGVDICEQAIEFSRSRYAQRGLSFRVMDLCGAVGDLAGQFDVVFCNIGEHLPDIDRFLELSRQALAPRGCLLLTVPAIATPGILEGNMRNPFHVTHLTPAGWLTKLGRFFHSVQGFRHWVLPEWVDEIGFPKEMALPPEESRIREQDFTFTATPHDELNRQAYNISLVTLSCIPRSTVGPPCEDETAFPEHWNVDEIRKRIELA